MICLCKKDDCTRCNPKEDCSEWVEHGGEIIKLLQPKYPNLRMKDLVEDDSTYVDSLCALMHMAHEHGIEVESVVKDSLKFFREERGINEGSDA